MIAIALYLALCVVCCIIAAFVGLMDDRNDWRKRAHIAEQKLLLRGGLRGAKPSPAREGRIEEFVGRVVEE